MTKIVCISDTHCQLDEIEVPEGDILIHAGDALSRGTYSEFSEFIKRFSALPHKYKVYVPGNHDRVTELNEELIRDDCTALGVRYINNESLEILGIKFYGSGITPRFHDWAWNRDSGDGGTSYGPNNINYDPIKPYWDAIPDEVDVLITHGPVKGILDVSVYDGRQCGCYYLLQRVMDIKPKYHVFGHIHNWGGMTEVVEGVTFINASVCNEAYDPTNEIVTIDYK